MDHSEVEYNKFEKNFYEEHPEIQQLQPHQVNDLRNTLGLRVGTIRYMRVPIWPIKRAGIWPEVSGIWPEVGGIWPEVGEKPPPI